MSETILRMSNISKSFSGVHALKGVQLPAAFFDQCDMVGDQRPLPPQNTEQDSGDDGHQAEHDQP